jgi:hypothetical protein
MANAHANIVRWSEIRILMLSTTVPRVCAATADVSAKVYQF